MSGGEECQTIQYCSNLQPCIKELTFCQGPTRVVATVQYELLGAVLLVHPGCTQGGRAHPGHQGQ